MSLKGVHMQIEMSKKAQKEFDKAPHKVQLLFAKWFETVSSMGIKEIRFKRNGYNDEALKGKLFGYRSSRLNKQWRVIYHHKTHEIISVERITPHEYRL